MEKRIKMRGKNCNKKEIIYPNPYLTDIDKWICSCKYFFNKQIYDLQAFNTF